MGYEELNSRLDAYNVLSPLYHTKLWAGWFPGKVQGDIPGDILNQDSPLGFRDCNNVVYRLGRLQKMFGYDNVNTSALESGAKVTSLFYSPVLDDFVGTVGTKLYKDVDTTVPSDITGAITITTNTLVDYAEWQFETTKYIVGVQQGNAPWTWTGSGNAAILGGSPPQGRWVKTWQNALWIANTSTEPSTIFFSNLGDPAVWTTNDDYKFDAPITGLGVLGNMLVIFGSDHIGVLTGTNNRLLTKVDRFINSVGCTGGFTVKNAFLNGEEVLVFHGADGFYAFNGTRALIKLSDPISNKYLSGTTASRWNEARLSQACATYDPRNNWYVVGISDGSDTENGFGLILDLGRPYQNEATGQLTVPHWPISDQAEEINCITLAKNSSGVPGLYFGSDDGFIYLYNPNTMNRNGAAYTGYATSKIYDTGHTLLLMEANIVGGEEGAAGEITESINFDLESGLGQANTQEMTAGGDVLDTTFILGPSTLSGKEFVFKNFEISNWGRFFQFDIRNTQLNDNMNVHGLNFIFKSLGVQPNAGF